jgi:DivIVA domain-containing protein
MEMWKVVTGMHNFEQDSQPRPQFKPAMRGYATGEVDGFLARLSDEPDLPVPAFSRVMRGYDPEVVDLYIERVKAARDRPLP